MTGYSLSKNEALTFFQWFFLASIAIIIAMIVNRQLASPGLFLVVVVAPIVEELVKTLVILMDKRKGPIRTTKIGLIVGLGFGVFETVFVYPNAILTRLFSSIPLHISTAGIDGFAVGSKRYWMIAGAIGLHSLYNSVGNSGIPFALNTDIVLALAPLAIFYFYLRKPKV
jgi:RsiW-degrading membrane proteinase PrsW (M82 family)